jgi:hypothetical protein
MPLGWIYSKEQATGKSQAMIAAAAIQGFSTAGMLAGSSTVNVGILERCFMQADLTVLVDDYVPTDVKDPASRQMAQLDRVLFDRTMRSVCNKNRIPYSPTVTSVRNYRGPPSCPVWIRLAELGEDGPDNRIPYIWNPILLEPPRLPVRHLKRPGRRPLCVVPVLRRLPARFLAELRIVAQGAPVARVPIVVTLLAAPRVDLPTHRTSAGSA